MATNTKKVTTTTKDIVNAEKTTEDYKATEINTADKKAPEKKPSVKKPVAAKKPAATKKSAAKKTAAKKEIEVSTFIQYNGRQAEEKEIVARVKDAWISSGRKEDEIKKMVLYIKPEENAVYYVINETETGSVGF